MEYPDLIFLINGIRTDKYVTFIKNFVVSIRNCFTLKVYIKTDSFIQLKLEISNVRLAKKPFLKNQLKLYKKFVILLNRF